MTTDLCLTTAISTDIEGMEGNVKVALGGGQNVEEESKVNISDEAVPLNLEKINVISISSGNANLQLYLVQQAVLHRDTLIFVELLGSNVLLVDDSVDSSASSVGEGAPRSHTVVEILHTHQSGLLACWIPRMKCQVRIGLW